MAFSVEDLADLMAVTQKYLHKAAWTDIAYDLQEYIALPNVLRKEKVQFESGTSIEWRVQVGKGTTARHVKLFEQDIANVPEVMQTASVPWRHTTVNYSIERREVAVNRTPARILDLMKVRRHAAMLDLADVMETAFWTGVAASTDDTTPIGLPYWIVRNISGTSAPTAAGGFNGGNPAAASTTGAGGLSSTTYPNWANWAHGYTNVTEDDLIKKMRKAAYKINFRSPSPHPELAGGGDRYVIYTNYNAYAAMETFVKQQNDNLGMDMAPTDGRVRFQGNKVVPVPYLDADAGDPVFFVNWTKFHPVFLRGEYMNESKPMVASNQHATSIVHVDLTWNNICYDRRRQAALCIST